MFFDLVRRNSRRSRKENSIFFSSLLVSIVAFYIVLSLSQQDIMVFLGQMESDAVDRLLQMIPLLYGVTLFLLFFLVYFASKYQLERRSHEFGIYLIMGMKRSRLFLMLLAEDFWSSLLSLGIGIPVSVLISEMTSLVTARLVGIGILGHQSAFSLHAVLWTVVGFLGIKLLAFLILSGKISRLEIGSMLTPAPEQAKPQSSARFHKALLLLGMLCLAIAYALAIWGLSWTSLFFMGITLLLGLLGTFLLFYGMRTVLASLAKNSRKRQGLAVFTFRQLQENVICQSHSMAVSSLLILAALCCFGFGIATAWSRGQDEHVLDYTFQSDYEGVDVAEILEKNGLRNHFQDLFQMKTGYIRLGEFESSFEMAQAIALLREMPQSRERDTLLHNLSQTDSPHIISLSGYNHLLAIAGKEMVKLETGQAAVYMDRDFLSGETLVNQMLAQEPEVHMAGESYYLTGEVQSLNLVVDSSITLSFALIVEDDDFERLTDGEYDIYWNGTLREETIQEHGLLQAMMEMNSILEHTALQCESYLQNVGRQLFYRVAGSYITLYLALIFLVIANTILGVQFLMRQQKTGRRYQTLIRLGSSYGALCNAARRQIRWHFGIPILVALLSSIFGIWALFTGLLPSAMRGNVLELFWLAVGVTILLCFIELGYLSAVSRASGKHILRLMEPEREE